MSEPEYDEYTEPKFCPKCGGSGGEQTCMYFAGLDRNSQGCRCGWRGLIYQRNSQADLDAAEKLARETWGTADGIAHAYLAGIHAEREASLKREQVIVRHVRHWGIGEPSKEEGSAAERAFREGVESGISQERGRLWQTPPRVEWRLNCKRCDTLHNVRIKVDGGGWSADRVNVNGGLKGITPECLAQSERESRVYFTFPGDDAVDEAVP